MNYYNCRFSPPNDWMEVPERDYNLPLTVSPHQILQQSYEDNPSFSMNYPRNVHPCFVNRQNEFYPFNDKSFPKETVSIRPCSPYSWNSHLKNTPEHFRHFTTNEMAMIRMPPCKYPRFSCPHTPFDYDNYREEVMFKEPILPGCMNLENALPHNAHYSELNPFANCNTPYFPWGNKNAYIPNPVTQDQNSSFNYTELQKSELVSDFCDDIGSKQFPGKEVNRITYPQENVGSDSPDITADTQTVVFKNYTEVQGTVDGIDSSYPNIQNMENQIPDPVLEDQSMQFSGHESHTTQIASDFSNNYSQLEEKQLVNITYPLENLQNIGADSRPMVSDNSTAAQETADNIDSFIHAENNKDPSEFENACNCMDENALAAYFLTCLYPNTQVMNDSREVPLTEQKSEKEVQTNVIQERLINYQDEKLENYENQINCNFKSSITDILGETSETSNDCKTNLETCSVQETENLYVGECLSELEENEMNMISTDCSLRNDHESKNNEYVSAIPQYHIECDGISEETLNACNLQSILDNTLNNEISDRNHTLSMPIINVNNENWISVDDSKEMLDGSDLDDYDSSKVQNCITDSILEFASSLWNVTPTIPICVKNCSSQDLNFLTAENCTLSCNANDIDTHTNPMDIISNIEQIPTVEKFPAEKNVESLSYPSNNTNITASSAKKHDNTGVIFNEETFPSDTNIGLDVSSLSKENFVVSSSPPDSDMQFDTVHPTTNADESKKLDFVYSHILNSDSFISPAETSLSSVTNYLLAEPIDLRMKEETPKLDDFEHIFSSQMTLLKNNQSSKKKQKAVKKRSKSSIIHMTLSPPSKLHFQPAEVINSSLTLLDNIFESDIDEYLDLDDALSLKQSKKEKKKSKWGEKKPTTRNSEKVSINQATKNLNPDKLNYDAESFKITKLSKGSIESYHDIMTQTSKLELKVSVERTVCKGGVPTQWSSSDRKPIAAVHFKNKQEQKVSESQYHLRYRKNHTKETNDIQEEQNNRTGSQSATSNYRKRSLRKLTISSGTSTKVTIKSDSDNPSRDKTYKKKNVSKKTSKKVKRTDKKVFSSSTETLTSSHSSSDIQTTMSTRNAGKHAKDTNITKQRKSKRNVNKIIERKQDENASKSNEQRIKKSTQKMNELAENKSNGRVKNKEILNRKDRNGVVVTTTEKQVDDSQEKNRNCKKERKQNSIIDTKMSCDAKKSQLQDTEPIAYRLRKRR